MPLVGLLPSSAPQLQPGRRPRWPASRPAGLRGVVAPLLLGCEQPGAGLGRVDIAARFKHGARATAGQYCGKDRQVTATPCAEWSVINVPHEPAIDVGQRNACPVDGRGCTVRSVRSPPCRAAMVHLGDGQAALGVPNRGSHGRQQLVAGGADATLSPCSRRSASTSRSSDSVHPAPPPARRAAAATAAVG